MTRGRKPYSQNGKILIRMDKNLHERLVKLAKLEQTTINALVTEWISNRILYHECVNQVEEENK